jgi:hypothetical protein
MMVHSERPIMRRVFLRCLVFAALAAAGSAFAIEAGSAPGADKATPVPSSKQTASTKPKKKQPLPFSAAFEATRTTELPAASIHAREQPSTQSTWTGIYVGGGVGAGVAK